MCCAADGEHRSTSVSWEVTWTLSVAVQWQWQHTEQKPRAHRMKGFWRRRAGKSRAGMCCYEKPELQMAWKTVLWGDVGFRSGAGCGLDKQPWTLIMGYRQSVIIKNVPLTPLSLRSLGHFSVFLGTARPCSWSWLNNNDCQHFKRASVSNAVKAREAEGKAEICGSLQGFYCESETRKDVCTVQCS